MMNIVFDLGSVVFKWEFENNIDGQLNNINKRNLILKEIYRHNDWIELDRGTLDLEEVIERGVVRTGLTKEEVSKVMNMIPQSLVPDIETLNLIKRIKNQNNHKLYVLSNMHLACIEYLKKQYFFWDLFDGVVFSGNIKMVKPEIEIYNYLINKFNLDAQETIFIDDKQENLIPAAKLKMKTIKFNNPKQCEKDLKEIGVI